MLLTLALVVFLSAIMVLFSQEFIRIFKGIFAIRGAKLILPLAFASWLVCLFDYPLLWAVYYYREFLAAAANALAYFIPFKTAALPVAKIILITSLAVIPVFLLDWIVRQKTYGAYRYVYLTSTLIWIISAFVMLVF